MACFLVPTTEAIVTTIVKKSADKTAQKSGKEIKNPFLKKMNLLNNMLWGGSALLAFEHIWHGEVTPWFPFLTAAADPADAAEMLHEMATTGTSMAILVTAVWVGIVAITGAMDKKAVKSDKEATGGALS